MLGVLLLYEVMNIFLKITRSYGLVLIQSKAEDRLHAGFSPGQMW